MSNALNSYRDGSRRSCLVTGATGLVGNNVVRKFLDTGWNVSVLVRPHHSGATAALEGLPVQKIMVNSKIKQVFKELLMESTWSFTQLQWCTVAGVTTTKCIGSM